MTTTSGVRRDSAAQRRHDGAEWSHWRSLRVRLPLFVAVIVTAVVMGLTFFEVRAVERAMEEELMDALYGTGRAVADDLRGRQTWPAAGETTEVLHEFMEASPTLRSLSVVEIDPAGNPELIVSTSSEELAEVLDLARGAVAARTLRTGQRSAIRLAAVPFSHDGRSMAVVASVSMAGVRQAGARGRTIALWFAIPTVLLVTLLVNLAMRLLVHRPLAHIRDTMERVEGGDLTARAPLVHRDELGHVAMRLNEMLHQLDNFSGRLQESVREATGELRLRNAELAESYERTLALQGALARAQRMGAVGRMAASVAHQVGTPLNLVSGYVQVLSEELSADARTRQRLEIVATQIQQVTRILRTMLDEARQPSPRQHTALRPIVERVCELAHPRLARSDVRLDLHLDEPLPAIDVDPIQLELALLNLISNALDAMAEGGTLVIRASATDEGVHLEIVDTGSGIPPELLPRIFDPWVTTKPVGHGTGLGLGIVRDVVEAHGGTISARNEPGGGAVFSIDLPHAAVDVSVFG